VAIRAIADPASMNLPNAISHSLNNNGQVVLARLLKYLISHPWEIPSLIKLGLHFNAAQKTLKTVALQLNAFVNF
jgi:adenosylhomocysteine nucleosidase